MGARLSSGSLVNILNTDQSSKFPMYFTNTENNFMSVHYILITYYLYADNASFFSATFSSQTGTEIPTTSDVKGVPSFNSK